MDFLTSIGPWDAHKREEKDPDVFLPVESCDAEGDGAEVHDEFVDDDGGNDRREVENELPNIFGVATVFVSKICWDVICVLFLGTSVF